MATIRIFSRHQCRLNGVFSLVPSESTAFTVSFRHHHRIALKSKTLLGGLVNNQCKVTSIKPLLGVVRFASTGPDGVETVASSSFNPADLPDIPTPVEQLVEQVSQFAGEPSFASIGLGGWTPVGMIQNCMEFLHVGLDIPWWLSIFIGTAVVRVLLFPIVIIAQRNAAKMNNNLPQMQVIQLKMTEARQTGNKLEAARYAQEMMMFMKEKKLNPLSNIIPPLAQAPVFISFFMGLRGMSNVPVDSLKTGGLFWFTDLTCPDQFFLLPIITSATLWLTIEVGTDTARLESMGMMRYFLRALPLVILPFTFSFPGAILCYWVSSNFISLGQVAILRVPAVREYFKIPKLVTHNKENLPITNKGFVKGFQESYTNMKITRELQAREHLDELQFNRAGKVPLQRTFKYDPTKTPAAGAVSAKKRE